MPDSEAESYRHHVTQCVECAAKVDELDFVSHALLSAVPQLSAPPEIRDRVMAVVRAEAELLRAAGAGADRPPRAEPRRFGWGFARLRPLTAGALAAVLLALGLGAGTLMRGGPSCTTRAGDRRSRGRRERQRQADGLRRQRDARARRDARRRPRPDLRAVARRPERPAGAQGRPALFSVRNGPGVGRRRQAAGGRTVLVTDEPLPKRQRGPDAHADRQGHRLSAGEPAASTRLLASAPWPSRRARRRRSPATATPTARRACRARTAAGRSARTA